jgi:DnaJ-class molecular chaperone
MARPNENQCPTCLGEGELWVWEECGDCNGTGEGPEPEPEPSEVMPDGVQ